MFWKFCYLGGGVIVRGVFVLGGNCPGGNCPGGNCPGGNCPRTMVYIYTLVRSTYVQFH